MDNLSDAHLEKKVVIIKDNIDFCSICLEKFSNINFLISVFAKERTIDKRICIDCYDVLLKNKFILLCVNCESISHVNPELGEIEFFDLDRNYNPEFMALLFTACALCNAQKN